MSRQLEPCQAIERSIITKYRKTLWRPFVEAVKRYRLIQAGDRIAVCISGGKDSMLMAKLLQQLHCHSDVPFELSFLVMDPGYSEANRRQIEANAALLQVPVTVFETDIFAAADAADHDACYLCARMRRGHLYSKARKLGCNKIALGHHFSDVVETTLIGMFWGAQLQAMLPKLHSTNFPGMELIRPLYCVHEEDIISWAGYNGLHFLRCACRLTEGVETGQLSSKRQEVKQLLRTLRRDEPNIEKNIFTAIHAVCLDTFPGYKTGGRQISFLDGYDAQETAGCREQADEGSEHI